MGRARLCHKIPAYGILGVALNISAVRSIWEALRPMQWPKNFLVFFPLIFGRKLFAFPENVQVAVTCLLFCLASSVSYLFNDLTDAEQDRKDPVKRLRPLAAGKITRTQALAAATTLAIVSFTTAYFLLPALAFVVVLYWLANALYSSLLKKAVLLDVFCLSTFFLLRILAGGIVAGVELSHWILALTAMLALFLGFSKRRQELVWLGEDSAAHRKVLARYSIPFLDQMMTILASSMAVTYLLYTVDVRTIQYVGSANLLYGTPFVYYGIFRYLYLIHQLQWRGDPVKILLTDKFLLISVLLWVIVSSAAIQLQW